MEHQGVRKTYRYRLDPTPEQAQALETVLSRCRTLYNVALEQRKTWWERGQGNGATYYQQKAELPDLKAACPEYAEINAQVLQDVIMRLERAFQAFFRRVKQARHRAIPASRGGTATTASPIPQYGNGAVLDGGVLSLSKIGRIRHAAPSPAGRHTQDGHDLAGGRWLVRLHLLRRRADAATAAHRTGDGHRPWH